MLHWNTEASAFGLQNAAYGVLRIHGDTVAEARKTIKRNLAGKRVNEVEAEIERLVNAEVLANLDVATNVMGLDEALSSGAMALLARM